MAKAKKFLFANESASTQSAVKKKDKAQNVFDKRIVEKLIHDIRERLKDPKDANKASLIIQQWIHESNDKKRTK